MKSQKGHIKKITETARWEPPRKAVYSEHSIAIHSISKADYVTALLAIIRTEFRSSWRRAVSVIFEKWPAISPYFSFLTKANVIFFFMCLVRSIIANLCPIMINLYALDFNMCRAEEVISFFLTLGVWPSSGMMDTTEEKLPLWNVL